MDSKSLTNELSSSLDLNQQIVDVLMTSFTKVLIEGLTSQSSIAIPSFGSFVPHKYDEEIKVDLSSGKKIIFPPQITVEFITASSLKKKFAESYE